MHQVFLDANTLLGFYSLTPADITQLERLVDLIKLGKLALLLPTQVTDEVRRNRARVIAERLKPLREGRLQAPIPALADKTPEAEALRRAMAEAQKAHTKLLSELMDAAQQGTLPADKLIAELVKNSAALNVAGAVEAAQQRKALGKPPGKGSSIGDGVNWETLLAHVPEMTSIHLVSADGDFASPLDPATFDEYLADEWAKAKYSDVEFYRDIKAFLDKVFPQIRLASDVRKYFLIDELVASRSFASSHTTVAELDRYDSFTLEEAARLLNGGLENTQVRWLAQDDDVTALLRKVLDPHRAALPKTLVDRWEYLRAGRGFMYGPVPSDDDIKQPLDAGSGQLAG